MRIYLDHNAGAPEHPEVTRAMEPYRGPEYGNPSSIHGHGRRARAALEEARGRVAARLGASRGEIIFSSGATEANNLALRGVLEAGAGHHLVISGVEHPSVDGPAAWLERRGFPVTRLPVDGEGRVSPDAAARALRPDTGLVSILMASHETGVLQPIEAIARRLRGRGVPLHVDAAQAAGRIPIQVGPLGADLLTLSGHKMGGPRGIGVLWRRRGTPLEAQLHGGGQEGGVRSGTPDLAAAVGLAAALDGAGRRWDPTRLARLRRRLEAGLLRAWPGAVVHGSGARRLPNTACIGFPGLDGEAAVMRLDLEGIAVSLGSACAAGALRPSPVLAAMGIGPDLARGSIRFSLGAETREEEIDETLRVFEATLSPARRRLDRLAEVG